MTYSNEEKILIVKNKPENESVTTYCNSIGVSKTSFYNWAKELEGDLEKPQFIDVTESNIFIGIILDLIYFIFCFFLGVWFNSIWFIAIAVYYLILLIIKLIIFISYTNNTFNYKVYLIILITLFILNFPLGGLIILTIIENEGFIYRDYIIYAIAFYAFYSFILSIVSIIKYKDNDNYIFKLSKTISFITSLVSIFTP